MRDFCVRWLSIFLFGSPLTHGLRVVRGEISAQEAATATLKDTVMGGAVGGVTAFTTATLAAACPPIAIALTTVAPLLAVVGAGGMAVEFFRILDDHKQAVKTYYESLTRQELGRLRIKPQQFQILQKYH
ncbi:MULTISPECIES: hypothetical protein [Nostocales]|uniref:hypothetical protein n=1 Tax=Nostocales TaxID=1161 RepID=UPI001F46F0C3|nr:MULTISPECIES: hypothetical protein [Nostocales]